MSGYVLSSENRFYAATESSYGVAAGITAANRIPAVRLSIEVQRERAERRDKTGGRTFVGWPAGLRRRTLFELRSYMTSWTDPAGAPSHNALFQAALGQPAALFAGGTVASIPGAAQLQFAAATTLVPGQAVRCGDEIRFVAAVIDGQTVQLNAPFTHPPAAGAPVGETATYLPGTEPASASIYDYWSPATSVQRILPGAAVDQLRIRLNGDYHEFVFRGAASDVLDSASFEEGQGGLSSFPEEPALAEMNYSVVPGNLGQIWLGNEPSQFFTVSEATFTLDNNLEVRNREFGAATPGCVVAGQRTVSVDLSLYQRTDDATRALYQAARQNSPISMMFQLGAQAGQLFGIYLQSVVPEVPEFDDQETRLQWRLARCRAQGTANDEAVVAFG